MEKIMIRFVWFFSIKTCRLWIRVAERYNISNAVALSHAIVVVDYLCTARNNGWSISLQKGGCKKELPKF